MQKHRASAPLHASQGDETGRLIGRGIVLLYVAFSLISTLAIALVLP